MKITYKHQFYAYHAAMLLLFVGYGLFLNHILSVPRVLYGYTFVAVFFGTGHIGSFFLKDYYRGRSYAKILNRDTATYGPSSFCLMALVVAFGLLQRITGYGGFLAGVFTALALHDIGNYCCAELIQRYPKGPEE